MTISHGIDIFFGFYLENASLRDENEEEPCQRYIEEVGRKEWLDYDEWNETWGRRLGVQLVRQTALVGGNKSGII